MTDNNSTANDTATGKMIVAELRAALADMATHFRRLNEIARSVDTATNKH
jgi:hypothetical protein